MADIITEDDLAVHMRQQFPTDEERDAAVQACQQGQSAVLTYLRRPDLSGVPEYAHYALKLVMLRQAASIYRAPGNERTSFSNGEVSIGLNPRILTEDEKVLLRQYRRLRSTTGEASGPLPVYPGVIVGAGAAIYGLRWPETFGWAAGGPPIDPPLDLT